MPVILFTATGSGIWKKPEGVTSIKVECWGGGGNGFAGGGGGGGGSYRQNHGYTNYPSQSVGNYPIESVNIPYFIAPGGAANGDTAWETNISNYWVTRWNRTTAQTGRDGSSTARGNGGSNTGPSGSISYTGGNGTYVLVGSVFSAGGGAAGSTGNGNNASVVDGGAATSEFGGEGADGTRNAGLYGGGGWNDRPGRQGLIRITFSYPDNSYFEYGNNKSSQVVANITDGANKFYYYPTITE